MAQTLIDSLKECNMEHGDINGNGVTELNMWKLRGNNSFPHLIKSLVHFHGPGNWASNVMLDLAQSKTLVLAS